MTEVQSVFQRGLNAPVAGPNRRGERRVAVIGAGACGLCAAKYLLEVGFEVTVFEIGSQIGGMWCYRNDNGRSSAVRHALQPDRRRNNTDRLGCFVLPTARPGGRCPPGPPARELVPWTPSPGSVRMGVSRVRDGAAGAERRVGAGRRCALSPTRRSAPAAPSRTRDTPIRTEPTEGFQGRALGGGPGGQRPLALLWEVQAPQPIGINPPLLGGGRRGR